MWREPRYERVRERKYGDEGMEERAQLLYPLEERVLNESRSVKPSEDRGKCHSVILYFSLILPPFNSYVKRQVGRGTESLQITNAKTFCP